MAQAPYINSRSPPPLQHPKPTHPAYPPPEPPQTPSGSTNSSPYSQAQRISSDGGYVRYASPPVVDHSTISGNSNSANIGYTSANPRTGYAASPNPIGYQGMGSMGAAPGMQPGQGMGGAPGPAGYGAWGNMNDATAQMGVQFGKSAVEAGQQYVQQNFTRYLPTGLIKTSFSVTNVYVLTKLRLILFPWRHKPWARQIRRSGEGGVEGWQPPRDDINAPDLYIPTMALVTYTLLCALASGLQSRFHPEVLGLSLSKAMVAVIIEFCGIKLGCYLLDVRGGGASGVELIGYGGYKFVGIIVTILASFLNFGTMVTTAVFLYTFCANAFFLLRSLKYVLLPDPSNMTAATSASLSHGQRSRRIQFLFVMAVSQVFWMGWLSRV